MSTNIAGFDAMAIKPAEMGGSILPVSDNFGHLVVIFDDEVVPTANNADNKRLVMKVRIVEGEFAGMEGTYGINLFWSGSTDKDNTTRNIAEGQLSALCHAVSVFKPQTIAELYNKPFRIVVEPQKGEENEKKGYTQVKGVLCHDGGIPGFPNKPKVERKANVAAPVQQAQPAASGAWGATAQPAATPAPVAAPVETPVQPTQPAGWGTTPASTPAPTGQPSWAQPK